MAANLSFCLAFSVLGWVAARESPSCSKNIENHKRKSLHLVIGIQTESFENRVIPNLFDFTFPLECNNYIYQFLIGLLRDGNGFFISIDTSYGANLKHRLERPSEFVFSSDYW